ncbi:hypothetical protein E2C01_057638 [Portunus trituberculatus]|uniref:Uncharacterized protein n=1 Tax=Portunus trituberculatus TaxID=210409 RepID=A0A5B7GU27_PORTR|nr:hypothetical protein [Portunus trituberculatus]
MQHHGPRHAHYKAAGVSTGARRPVGLPGTCSRVPVTVLVGVVVEVAAAAAAAVMVAVVVVVGCRGAGRAGDDCGVTERLRSWCERNDCSEL